MLWTMGGPLIHKISGRSHGKVFQKDSEKVPFFPLTYRFTGRFRRFGNLPKKKFTSKPFRRRKIAGPKPWKIPSSSTKRHLQGPRLFRWLPWRKRNLFTSDFAKCSLEVVSGNLVPLIIPNWQYIPLIYHLSRWCPSLLLRLLFTPFFNRLVYELHHFDQLSGALTSEWFFWGDLRSSLQFCTKMTST